MATKAKTGVQDRILKAALAIAEEEGWASVGLSAVAARAKVPLVELRCHYRDTDAFGGIDSILIGVINVQDYACSGSLLIILINGTRHFYLKSFVIKIR